MSSETRSPGREVTARFFTNRRKEPHLLDIKNGWVFHDFSEFPVIPSLHTQALIDLEGRHPKLIEHLTVSSKSQNEFDHRYAEMLRRAEYLEIAERTVNGVKVGFLERLDRTGAKIHAIFEDPQHPDHGWPHIYRVGRETHFLSLVYPNYQYNGFREMLISSLFTEYHDKAQISALLWNRENKGQTIKIKAGHAEEDGILVELLKPEIQKYGVMSEQLAREVAEVTSILIFLHDIPERMIQRIKGKVKANWMEDDTMQTLSSELLLHHYYEGDLNMFTTSRSQRLTIMKDVKNKSGVIAAGGRTWGMHPEYEIAFSDQLEEYSKDNTPMYLEVPDELMACILDVALICRNSDVKDMMYTDKAHPRKFHVDRSMKRNIFSTEDGIYERIIGDIGDDTRSDFERAMWEVFAYIRLNKDSKIWEDSSMRKRIIFTSLVAFEETRQFFCELLDGEEGFSALNKTVAERLYTLGIKALKNAGAIKDQIFPFIQELEDYKDVETIDAAVLSNFKILGETAKAIEYRRRYTQRREEIMQEIEHSISRLREKPNSVDHQAYTYTEPEVKLYERVCEQLAEYLFVLIQHEVTPEQFADYLHRRHDGDSFDSIGSIEDMKTLIPLTIEQKNMLHRLAHMELRSTP